MYSDAVSAAAPAPPARHTRAPFTQSGKCGWKVLIAANFGMGLSIFG
ncbi:unnamed protein product [Amoebophrya sp. A25]|nr:unnamed protein product [Amoebophrya sp. A25]|eukprot:GSA25T00027421001.1